VPFLRPAELARHDTPMLAVVEHALHWADATGERFEAVCLLQPTTPLRSAAVIDRCVALLREGAADTVMTVLPVPSAHHPDWVYFADAAGALHLSTGGREPPTRRQALRPAWHREGSVYVVRREVVLEQRSLYGATVFGVPLDPDRSVNIDEPADWARAESLVRALATTTEGAS
jgi:CMP-N-acetylneuraminic acid synthetase